DGLGATGVQIFSNVNGRPLDEPEWAPLFDRMAARRLPIWLHPARPAVFADYPGEKRSRYDIWWAFGWPYETTAAMARLVFRSEGLGATGVQIFSNVNGRPLDEPEWAPLFDRMAARRLPIWLHPARPAVFADYPGEKRSRYDIWWAFGWPYETTAAMARLVFAGLFDRHPDLAIITHHMGAMLPYFEGRAGGGLDQLGSRTEDRDDAVALVGLKRRPLDYFKMFYGDTALFGARHAMECGLAFFGAERVLFGTDMPFDPEKGPGFIRDTIGAMERMQATPAEKAKIYEGNARRMLRLR